MDEKLLKPYDAKNTESKIYKLWEESGFFNPDVCIEKGATQKDAETFSIVLPPPNVTGILHLGSAIMLAIEDTVVRYARMRGKKTLWLPGTDSAAIATQAKVEKEIQKSENLSRHDLGREELLKRIDTFVEQSKTTILSQIRGMGASVDWSRYAYTMDEKRYHAVMEAFVRMYDAGLIYRGNRIVNWDPKGQTTISDDEIVYEERKSKLYTFKYSKDFPISISTTRPETKVGDTAVAVHPDDTRYQQFIGKEYDLEFCGVPIHIKIIADKEVDPAFGTGALGVTPAHSFIDWEMANRHDIPRPQVINEYAKMKIGGENLLGKKVAEAREIVIEWLRTEELLEKEEEIQQNVPTAERTGGLIEPLPKLQWFIDVNKKIPSRENKSLKELMREPFDKNEIHIIPEYFTKTYFYWIDNLRDWCISRQIWFGHRIPVWYKGDQIYCGINPPTEEGWVQESDVLDTWFSAALWPFSTMGWPDNTKDLETYYPTAILETGYDILPFWVARMILMGQFILGKIPFKTVYLHGIVRDAQGRKISKSLGNNIDPIDMGIKYGTDALRFSLISSTAPGTDSKISEDKIKGYSKFANKIWNATRFVLDNTKDFTPPENPTYDEEDAKSDAELKALITEITKEMEEYKFYIVAEKLYHYFWHTFADIIIERSKKKIIESETTKANVDGTKALLVNQLRTLVTALHPFMPFVTEEIWSMLPNTKNLLMIERWPEPMETSKK